MSVGSPSPCLTDASRHPVWTASADADGLGVDAGAVGAELPWGIGVCAFTLAPDHPEVLVVPDMMEDARFNSM